MITPDLDLKQTPLHQAHLALNAKMISFGGWTMPLQYAEGILAEYEATRRQVTVFDTAHMGEFLVDGDPASTGLDRIVTQSIQDMPLATCRYGVMLNEHGGVIDDLIVYRLKENQWMIVVNAGTMEKDERHFLGVLRTPQAFRNMSLTLGKLDIQGPQSRETLAGFIQGIDALDYYTATECDVLGEKVLVSRTGYTGELGYEIYFPCAKMTALWEELMRRGVKPAGLGVRDVLRIEMGYCLYGHELDEQMSPLAAGLDRFMDWEKDFIGKEALLEEREKGSPQRMVGFVSETRRSPRAGQKIFSSSGEEMGWVTSGTFGPGLMRGIGLGFVARGCGEQGEKIMVGSMANGVAAEITSRPFYKFGSLKS